MTGWGDYTDTQYSAASPMAVNANTDTVLSNNKGSVIESQKPVDVDTFYDGTVIKGRSGDGILITVEYTAVPTDQSTNSIETWLDITGGTGTPETFANLYRTINTFPKGQYEPRKISFTIAGYTLGTWQENGALVKIRADGDCDIYGARLRITRTHKAR